MMMLLFQLEKRVDRIWKKMIRMRSDIILALSKDDDYFLFLREYPIYHKLLSRSPEDLQIFMDDYKLKRRKRLVDKVDDLSMMITLAKELM